ncbi:TolB family protein [Micromonospora sp. NPDC004704]
MSHATDEALRRAVHGLAGEARVATDLAPLAMARGRRVRRQRRIVGVAAAVVAIAVIASPFVWLRPGPEVRPIGPHLIVPTSGDPTGPSASPTPSTVQAAGSAWWSRPLQLSGSWIVTGATTTGTPRQPAYVLDRTRNSYVAYTAYDEVWAAPSGNLAAVYDYNRPGETGLLNVATGAVRWVRTGSHVMTAKWSPDGSKVLLTNINMQTGGGYTAIIVTVADRKVREFSASAATYLCTDYCQFTWMPDGKEVVLAQTDPAAPNSEKTRAARRGLQLFSADTGKPTRFLPIRGDVAGPYSWSPDGRSVVVQGQQDPQLVDATTGVVLGVLPSADAFWPADDRLMFVEDRAGYPSAIEMDLQGTEYAQFSLPPELLGRQISVAPR